MFEGPYLTSYQRQKYYWMLMTAAKETGDRETYVDAMEHFIKNTMEVDSLKSFAIRKEIMVRDSILPTPLLSNVVAHEKKKARPVNRPDHYFMVISGVLALLLIIYMTLYIRLLLKKSRR